MLPGQLSKWLTYTQTLYEVHYQEDQHVVEHSTSTIIEGIKSYSSTPLGPLHR